MKKQGFGSELEQRISEVLYYVWDPFNLGPDDVAARGEYDSFVFRVNEALVGHKGPKEVADLLHAIEVDRLELKGNYASCQAAADILVDWAERLSRSSRGE